MATLAGAARTTTGSRRKPADAGASRVIEPRAAARAARPGASSGATATSSTASRAATSPVRYKQSAIGVALGGPPAAARSRRSSASSSGCWPRSRRSTACRIRSSRSPGWCSGCSSRRRCTQASDSTVVSAQLISKVYFPRLIIPLPRHGARWSTSSSPSSWSLGTMLVYGVTPPVADPAGAADRRCSRSPPRSASASGSPRSTSATATRTVVPFLILVGLFISRSSIRSTSCPTSSSRCTRSTRGRAPGAVPLDAVPGARASRVLVSCSRSWSSARRCWSPALPTSSAPSAPSRTCI